MERYPYPANAWQHCRGGEFSMLSIIWKNDKKEENKRKNEKTSDIFKKQDFENTFCSKKSQNRI